MAPPLEIAVPTLRKYEKLWKTISVTGQATIRTTENHAPTVIQALRKEKARENVQRKLFELPTFGRLKHEMKTLNTTRGGQSVVEIRFFLTVGDKDYT